MSVGQFLPAVSVAGAEPFLSASRAAIARESAADALRRLRARACDGREFLGWLDLPETMRQGLPEILSAAERFREAVDALVVIGIGGSSLGARAALSALGHRASELRDPRERHPVVFAGHHLSSETLRETLASLNDVDYGINVISKSGTTTEPGIVFRIFLEDLKRRHPDGGWQQRVVATTDPIKGALRNLAEAERLTALEIPQNVGGRFSVLSAVGLFPLAYAGIDTAALLSGAAEMSALLLTDQTDSNPAVTLAAARHSLQEAGFTVDVLSFTTPRLRQFAGWWQQLFGESEGKAGAGPFPALCEIPADLHSLGQYLQDGRRQVYETFLHVAEEARPLTVPAGESRDGLDYLVGRPLGDVLSAARHGALAAHAGGGVPTLEVTLPALRPRAIGAAFYFFEVTVALSAALLGVNPFDQPGVEAYKRNMFKRLGRPGF